MAKIISIILDPHLAGNTLCGFSYKVDQWLRLEYAVADGDTIGSFDALRARIRDELITELGKDYVE